MLKQEVAARSGSPHSGKVDGDLPVRRLLRAKRLPLQSQISQSTYVQSGSVRGNAGDGLDEAVFRHFFSAELARDPAMIHGHDPVGDMEYLRHFR